ncbi:hypothetical protein BGZ73_007809 [Actinomortierella ambigua]|nr:hypothetical protein BGZ73_007809 [Actinomortierella ambigua]
MVNSESLSLESPLSIHPSFSAALFEAAQKYQCPIKVPRHPDLLAYIANIVAAIKQELLKDTIERIAVVILAPGSSHQNDTSSTGPTVPERFVFHMSPLGATDVVHQEQLQRQQQYSSVAKGKRRARDDDDDEADLFEDAVQPPTDMYTVTKRETASGRSGQSVTVIGHRTVEANEVTAMKLRAILLRIGACCSVLPALPTEMRDESLGLDSSNEFPWSPISSRVSQDRDKISHTNVANNSILADLPSISLPSLVESPSAPAASVASSPYTHLFSPPGRPSLGGGAAAVGFTPPSPFTPPPKKIVPVKTIDLESLQLELFIEYSRP